MAWVFARRAARLGPRLAALLALVLVSSCAITTSTVCVVGGPTIDDPWVRSPIGPDRPAAGYMVITGAADHGDVLLGVTSPVAGSVEIHETTAGASGMSAMHPVEKLAIGPGESVALEPGGYHLMLMDLSGELRAGATVELVLEFETAGMVSVTAMVRQG